MPSKFILGSIAMNTSSVVQLGMRRVLVLELEGQQGKAEPKDESIVSWPYEISNHNHLSY